VKCFQHITADALGTCRTCSKGLCGACARDLGFGIVCSDACAELATTQRLIQQRAAVMYRTGSAKQRIPVVTLMFLVFGLLAIGVGIAQWMNGDWPSPLIIVGAIFIAFAGLVYHRARKLGINAL
jgi:hypothetical protein